MAKRRLANRPYDCRWRSRGVLGIYRLNVMPKNGKPIVIRAVHPNIGVTLWYEKQLNALLADAYLDAALELTLAYRDRPKVGIVAQDSIRAVWVRDDGPPRIALSMAQDAAPTVQRIDKVLKRWGKKWSLRFDKLSLDLSKKFAGRAFSVTDTSMREALKAAGFTVTFKPTRKSMQAYKLVVADNVGLIKNLQSDFYNRIQQDVWASVRAGADMGALSTKLQRSYGITKERAALISRDQNAKAKAVIETTRRQELGIKQAIWQHSSAGKEPRPVHAKWGRDQQVFDLSKGLYDPEAGEWVLPGQLINCRCTSRAIIPGFTE